MKADWHSVKLDGHPSDEGLYMITVEGAIENLAEGTALGEKLTGITYGEAHETAVSLFRTLKRTTGSPDEFYQYALYLLQDMVINPDDFAEMYDLTEEQVMEIYEEMFGGMG